MADLTTAMRTLIEDFEVAESHIASKAVHIKRHNGVSLTPVGNGVNGLAV
jgi:hypothetical protein